MPDIKPNTDPRRKCAWIADFTPAPTPEEQLPTRTRPGFDSCEAAETKVALTGDDACLPLRAGMCVGTVVTWYLDFERRRGVAAETIARYAGVLDRLLTPQLRERPFRALSPADLMLVLVPRRGRTLAPKTQDEYARIVGRLTTAAIIGGFAEVDIAAAFVRQHAVKRVDRLRQQPTEKTFEDVCAVACPAARAIFELETTLFPGSDTIARMVWGDVDFSAGRLFLPHAPTPGRQNRTGRWRDMGEDLLIALLRWRALSFACAPADPLFTAPDGVALVAGDVSQLIHGAQVRAGLVATTRRTDGSGRVQGMPRGKYLPGAFKATARRRIAKTVTSLLTLARRVNRESTESLQVERRYLKKRMGHHKPVATLGVLA